MNKTLMIRSLLLSLVVLGSCFRVGTPFAQGQGVKLKTLVFEADEATQKKGLKITVVHYHKNGEGKEVSQRLSLEKATQIYYNTPQYLTPNSVKNKVRKIDTN